MNKDAPFFQHTHSIQLPKLDGWLYLFRPSRLSKCNDTGSSHRSIQHGRVDEPVPMQAGDIQLLHSQTEGADSKASCRTWHDSVCYGLTHLLDPVLILFLFSDHHHIAALVAIVGVANWQIGKSFLNENLIFKQFAKETQTQPLPFLCSSHC